MELRFAHFGNGITVYDKDNYDEVLRDYKIVAHIRPDRTIKFYVPFSYNARLHREVKHFANNKNPTISITQNVPVFNTKV